jgi:DNA-binding transcriptional ArsR family regulator
MDVDEVTAVERVRAVAVLVGEPARAVMLWSLLEGRSKPASELAFHANVSAQSASGHLAKLLGAGLLAVERRGRHRFYKLANAEVATAVESIAALMPRDHVPRLPSRQTPMLRYARSCYDHLAGSLGVAITEALQRKRWLLPEGNGYLVTPSGIRGLATIAIDLGAIHMPRRALTRQCLDWSERRPHLAGALGAELLKALLAAKWLVRVRDTRVLRVTNEGRRELNAMFGLSL